MLRDLHFLTMISSLAETPQLLQQEDVTCPYLVMLGICGV